MHKKYLFSVPSLFFVIALLFLFLTVPSHSAIAAQSLSSDAIPTISSGGPECWPLDVVLLIDESLSVSRPGGNDPQGYRFIATKQILDVLIANRRFQCPEAVHRLGVIAFGDYTQAALEMVPIDISSEITDTERIKEWVFPFKEAVDDIKDYAPQNATLPGLAFEKADELLKQAPRLPTPQEYGLRQQVVILMTDGNPELSTSASWRAEYLENLSATLNGADWHQRHIWVVALKANGGAYLNITAFDGKTVGEVWRDIAVSHGGRLEDMPYNEQALATTLDNIITEEFGQPGIPLECGDFMVDPYLEDVRFLFSKRLELREVPIILSKLDDQTGAVTHQWIMGDSRMASPDSRMILPEGGYRQEDIIEEYFFQFPLPGKWNFQLYNVEESECRAGVDARQTPQEFGFEVKLTDSVIPQVEEAPYYDVEAPEHFIVQVLAPVNPFEELPAYPLVIEGTVQLPDGTSQLPDGSLYPPVAFEVYGGDLWHSTQPILTPDKGDYTLTIMGSLPHYVTFTETQEAELHYRPAFTQALTFEGRHYGRMSFEITSPTEGESMPCNTVANGQAVGYSVPLTVQLLAPNGEAADTGFYLTSDPVQSFVATLLDSNGNVLSTGALAPSGGSAIGAFEGAMLAGESAVVGCGAVSIQVDFVGSVDAEKFILPRTTDTVTFERWLAEGIAVTITVPTPGEKFLLHPDFWAARNADVVQPVALSFELQNLTGEPIDPAQLTTGALEALYTASLVAPGGAREVLTLTVSGGTFSANGGLTMTQGGDYSFEVQVNPDAFREGFIPVTEAPVTVQFTRRDLLWTSPTTFRIVAAIAAAIVVFIVGLTIYLITGAPRGSLKLTEYGKLDTQLASLPLKGGRHPTFTSGGICPVLLFPLCFPVTRKPKLATLGIKRIRTTRIKGSSEMVKVEITGLNGQPLSEPALTKSTPNNPSFPSSLTTPTGEYIDVIYESIPSPKS